MLKNIKRFINKVYPSSDLAVADIKTGDSLVIGGFGLCGIPENLIRALSKKDINDMTLHTTVSGTPTQGAGILISKKMISRLHTSFIGGNPVAEDLYFNGEIELNLTPMGSIVEKIRCGSFGILGFYTRTGADTLVEHGGIPTKYSKDGKTVEKYSTAKNSIIENNIKYLFEKSIKTDFAFVKAWKADTFGNLIYRKTARNSNADLPGAAKITIAEVEEIVEAGELDPDQIHTPGILVQRVVKGEVFEKAIEKLTLNKGLGIQIPGSPEKIHIRETIARRAAKEVKDGMVVNLGIGIPTLVPNYIRDIDMVIHGENGILGIGPYPVEGQQDPDLTNAGKETITMKTGASTFSSSTSFGMIRGCHLDLTMIGGLQVSEEGDLASWIIPGKLVRGMGGAMDLASSYTKCVVCMEHTSKKDSKVINKCTLPITGKKVVNVLITNLGVFEFRKDTGMTLTEIAKGVTLDQIKNNTTAKYSVSSSLKTMD